MEKLGGLLCFVRPDLDPKSIAKIIKIGLEIKLQVLFIFLFPKS